MKLATTFKSLDIPIEKKDFIKQYLLLWKGYLNLTDSEITILNELLYMYFDLYKKNGNKDLSFIEVFNSENRKFISDKLELSIHSFNNTFMRLKNKGIIVKTKYGYEVNSRLLPVKSITFNFNIKDDVTSIT